MKKLLYISYLFPPVGGSGVQRSLKFAKYLPEFGWEPIMLVANHRFLKQPKDYSLLTEVNPKQARYKTFMPDVRWMYKLLWGLRLHKVVDWINRYCFIPDADILWLPFAKRKLNQVLREHKIDMVFITAPPYSVLFLGEYIKKKYGIDYCVDFRDLWTLGVGVADNPPSKRIMYKTSSWEKNILMQAKQVVYVNDTMVEKALQAYPFLNRTKLSSITNGYDETDFTDALVYVPRDKMHIVFTGSLYGRFQPDCIWQATTELVESGNLSADKLCFDIYGANTPSFVLGSYAGNPTITSMVNIHGYLAHPQSINRICSADALLLLSPVGKGSDAESHSKLYEYMRSERPIWAVVGLKSIGAEILQQSGTSFIADSSSLAAIKYTLLLLYDKWKAGELHVLPDTEYISSFERRALTAKLAQVLDSAVEGAK
ncbi:MAG: hypothetical protein PHY48_04350 [Candidatus Cloacimonetes bacterium]|nr:hypothetical protein [Candidatus Cloacimonadota bacterium]